MASNNPQTAKSKLSAPSTSSLRITPSNSPVLKPPARSPNKHSPYQSSLSLQTVIGTTTAGPNGFSAHASSRTFALCAGSSAILVELDENLSLSQRFFRARPTATGLNPVPSFYNPSTPPTTPESRARPVQGTGRQGANGSLYPISPNAEGNEANASRTWTSRERIKAVTSVSISPNGRFLAVGETGYNPRVLIFSTAKDSPHDSPLSIMSEHSFGVRGLAFSPDTQWLASLGDINDGFLFVWSINLRSAAAKLHSTNKCTAFVRDMCWLGQDLVTVGTRHVKVWRLGDPSANTTNQSPVALYARNCLLGSLVDSAFTCVASISDNEAVICSDTGAVCLLDDTGGQQKLRLVKAFDFGIRCVTVDFDSNLVWFGGRGHNCQKCSIEELRSTTSPPAPSSSSLLRHGPRSKTPAIASMGAITSQMITVDSTRAIRVCSLEKLGQNQIESQADISMPAHKESVLGLGSLRVPNSYSADFFTWSSGGAVSFWDLRGKCGAVKNVDLEQLSRTDDDMNELKIIRAIEDLGLFVSGDRYGVLRTIKWDNWQCSNEVRAHGAEVTDIAVHSDGTTCLVATSGRDRMVQLFRCTADSFELIQTMDDHVGAVGRLLFVNDGEKLLSCSADRTVIIRERMTREVDGTSIPAFVIAKVITLKASPVSMAVVPDDQDGLVLSTIDRQIHKFDISSARHIHSCRAADPETGDTVVLSSLTVEKAKSGQSPRLLIGVSTTDKSIRIYDFERDLLLTREFGHTEGVSDVMVLQEDCTSPSKAIKRTLVSTGLDGVIMTWNLSVEPSQSPEEGQQQSVNGSEETPSKELTAAKPPLRRILSRTEVAGFKPLDATPSPCPAPTRDPSPPRIRKKTSRVSIGPQVTKNGNTTSPTAVPTPPLPPNHRSPTSPLHSDRKGKRDGSWSPPSPKSSGPPKTLTTRNSRASLRRSSIDPRAHQPKANSGAPNGSEFGSLNMSTEQVCRTLRAYRKKLQGSADSVNTANELEKELDLTSRALSEHASKRSQSNEESSDSHKSNKKKWMSASTKTPTRPPRRIPSTPNLGQTRKERLHRANSLDADGTR